MRPLTDDEAIFDATRHWLLQAVIGLNLCPFAKNVYVKNLIRYVIIRACEEPVILADIETEIRHLSATDSTELDTTLLILPDGFHDFDDFNGFLPRAERLLKRTKMTGVLQIASFHPEYRFADSRPDDIENYSNRAPYPILHLLRESSIATGLLAFPDASVIYERNQETLRRLGLEGWNDRMRNQFHP
ncbi:peptidase [Pollutimonas nitritireducens]|uniref:Peptidase n=1 Tax=Pollutimonas nitritireducens TaxID=2045209 RepID=A0A2N4UGZ1_9BURK|nr:DUF1415 domain-containing protein [Pollutimonas nitritireducens]PLC54311.1 peptidase [Pollutimonas nitritireducens]